jgi:hypothetical protein
METPPATYRQLLPQLPAELRHIVYENTISEEDNPATNTNIPFQQKIYDSSHTTVTLTPIHHGTPNLLALRKAKFLEAHEYHSWLLSSAIELRIGVVFKGNMQTFIQDHWDKKMLAHLKTLAKKHPWVKDVVNYDIQILWTPLAAPRDAKRKANVGAIAKRMVDVLTSLMDVDDKVKREKGGVKTGLHVADYVATTYVFSSQEFGLSTFVKTMDDKLAQTRAVYVAPRAPASWSVDGLPEQFTRAIYYAAADRNLLVEDEGVVEWTDWTRGDLVFKKKEEVGAKGVVTLSLGSQEETFSDWRLAKTIYLAMVEECKRVS